MGRRRLRPLTHNRPKPLLPAATTPILEHVFDQLLEAGVSDITVVVGYGKHRVQSYFGPTYRGVPLTYVTQDQQLGSGHALLMAEPEIDGTTLVVNGDQLVESEIMCDVLDAHTDQAATLGLLSRPDTSEYGGLSSRMEPSPRSLKTPKTIGITDLTLVSTYSSHGSSRRFDQLRRVPESNHFRPESPASSSRMRRSMES